MVKQIFAYEIFANLEYPRLIPHLAKICLNHSDKFQVSYLEMSLISPSVDRFYLPLQ